MDSRIVLASLLMLSLGSLQAKDLSIAAWNLEHLNADGAQGCIDREPNDYSIITDHVQSMGFDVVAVQEVKDVAAARRVFSEADWNLEISERPKSEPNRECWDAPGRMLQHLATGFAIRKGIEYTRHDDFVALGVDNDFQRWGTDISIDGERPLRLLSVHLASGCWGPQQDEDDSRADICETLNQQFDLLGTWVSTRDANDEDFVVLGDFNRRLSLDNDWGWQKLTKVNAELSLLTGELEAQCDPRYKDLIDHLVVDASTASRVDMSSVREGKRVAQSPDHCSVSARFAF